MVNKRLNSTSALFYKKLHKKKVNPPLPTVSPPEWSAPAAVQSILYETPTPIAQPRKQHVLNCLVQNESGVLARVSSTLAARGFNIDSLVVCNTEVKNLSRMTIVLKGQDGVIEQARRQLEDLVPVYAVLDYTKTEIVKRELVLARISLMGSEYFQDLLIQHKHFNIEDKSKVSKNNDNKCKMIEEIRENTFHPSNLPPSEILRLKHEHLNDIINLSKNFGARVVDISETNCIVEIAAKPTRVSAFLKLLEPFGILECARSGMMALPRTPLKKDEHDDEIEKINEIVDISQLPPG